MNPEPKVDKYNQNDWSFEFAKSILSPSTEIEAIGKILDLNSTPDVVFGKNFAKLSHKNKPFFFCVDPRDCLFFCNFEARQKYLQPQDFRESHVINHVNIAPDHVQIKFAEFWKDKKFPDASKLSTLIEKSDSFYSSAYKGSVRSVNNPDITEYGDLQEQYKHQIHTESTNEEIPLHRLTPDNPIVWNNEIGLYEDELEDSGYSMSEFRFRVMKDCYFGLIRHYLRVDDVLIRIYDTRIFHDFSTDYILREFQSRQNTYLELTQKGFHFDHGWLMDPAQSHKIYPKMDVRFIQREKIFF